MKSSTILLAALVFALPLVAAAAPEEAAPAPVTLGDLYAQPAAGCSEGASFALAGDSAQPVELTGCSAQNSCNGYGGVPISCQGSILTSCFVGFCSVRCDSQTTYCCDISELECPNRACPYCACIAEGIFSPAECSDQVCGLGGD